MSEFQWDGKKQAVAVGLAEGFSQQELAAAQGVSDRTIRRWLQDAAFTAEVDRLSVMYGLASRAERLRAAKRLVRERSADVQIQTSKDLLDWMKYIQSETDGVKSELAASLAELVASVAGGSSGEATATEETQGESE